VPSTSFTWSTSAAISDSNAGRLETKTPVKTTAGSGNVSVGTSPMMCPRASWTTPAASRPRLTRHPSTANDVAWNAPAGTPTQPESAVPPSAAGSSRTSSIATKPPRLPVTAKRVSLVRDR